MSEYVNHPAHYNTGKIEVIEIIEDQRLNFHLGNCIKYLCRAGRKSEGSEIQDLHKARWYLQRQIELLEARAQGRDPKRPNDMNPRRTSATAASISNLVDGTMGTAKAAPTSGDTLCPVCKKYIPENMSVMLHVNDEHPKSFDSLYRVAHSRATYEASRFVPRCTRCQIDLSNPDFDRSQCKTCNGGRDLAEIKPGNLA